MSRDQRCIIVDSEVLTYICLAELGKVKKGVIYEIQNCGCRNA